jgi:hypothetical protein
MANGSFIVQNNLQVGNLTLYSANSDVSTTGNLSSTSVTPQLTSTMVANNFSTANAVITGGYINNLANLTSVTERATNFSTANAVITGGYINNLANLTSVTEQTTNFSTANAVITGGYINNLANISSTGNIYSGNSFDQVQLTGGYTSAVSALNLGSTTTGGRFSVSYDRSSGITTLNTGTVVSPVGAGTISAAGVWSLPGLSVSGTTTLAGNVQITGQGEFITNNLIVGGNLFVAGNTVTVDSTTVTTNDLQFVAAKNAGTSAAANNAGLVTPYSAMVYNSAQTAWQSNVSLVPNANLTLNLGSTTSWWNTLYGVSTQAKYADLAENYQADRHYNPGTVLMFGGDQEVTLATAATPAVAGIVSTNPAHLMNGALSGTNVVPLALMGRVPCMVVGPIAKGDLMVSAGFGYAKADNQAMIGTVIGKALADFPLNAKGMIEVVVGRV